MPADPGFLGAVIFSLVFLGTLAAGAILSARLNSDRRRAVSRVRELGKPPPAIPGPRRGYRWGLSALLKVGTLAGAAHQSSSAKMRTALMQAGHFHPNAPVLFHGGTLLLATALAGAASAAVYFLTPAPAARSKANLFLRLPPWTRVAAAAAVGGLAGVAASRLWLAQAVRRRQQRLRAALPDALDMLVLCLEGGVSFHAAMQRVTDELHAVHPALGEEMSIVQQEILLGLSGGEALRKFAGRCGLPDVRDLSLVLLQSERYGAGLTKALRGFADNVRLQRQQRAEERAHKAGVKILFPTLLCIFPAIFIVLLGPAAMQLSRLFAR